MSKLGFAVAECLLSKYSSHCYELFPCSVTGIVSIIISCALQLYLVDSSLILKRKSTTQEFFNNTCLFIVLNSECVCPSVYSVMLLKSVGFLGRKGEGRDTFRSI